MQCSLRPDVAKHLLAQDLLLLKTLPEAQRTQELTPWLGLDLATTWHHLISFQILPPEGRRPGPDG